MGAIFRLRLGIGEPAETAAAAAKAGVRLLGLASEGRPLGGEHWECPSALLVGHERHGLGRWNALCEALLAIPMAGQAESLSAAVAGSIALYEATRRTICQESTPPPKSQDYRG
jgi:tRNA G18 (ribose-2'-O)-methylase SpoU